MSISGRIQYPGGIDASLEGAGKWFDECNRSGKEAPDYHTVEGVEGLFDRMHSLCPRTRLQGNFDKGLCDKDLNSR